VGETGEVVEPGGADVGVAEEFFLGLLEVLDAHFFAGDEVGVAEEEFLGVGLEDFPGRVGDDGVEAAAVDDDVVEFVGPVEGGEFFDVFHFEQAFGGPGFLAFCGVPGGLLEWDAETLEFKEEELVENLAGGAVGGLDLLAQAGECLETHLSPCRLG
jgi:hypothetical protein